MKILRRLLYDEKGSLVSTEALIFISGVVVLSGIIVGALRIPLKTMHEGTVGNITRLSRGY